VPEHDGLRLEADIVSLYSAHYLCLLEMENSMSNQEQVSDGFVIINPLTGRPMKQTPQGISLEGIYFPTKEELEEFVNQHWTNPVFMADGGDMLPPD
jgi:hypothetical protein